MSTAVTQQCLAPTGDEDICTRLAREIDEMINRDKRQCGDGGTHGLLHRFREQIAGANGPGTAGWATHDQTIKEQQDGLRKRLNDYNKNNCGSKVPITQDAWKWATRARPTQEQWAGPELPAALESSASRFSWDALEKATGLTGAALVLYLVISEGSRLVFPPRNLLPVP